ncbi:hypothetical protein MUK42_35946 [Musa troglodytarum]|uniref:Uncharacterized protein n=1 Tax=Musa troglodytarum TaxID=320322 RepID=A0A9E7JAH4_9LILI|nr:hypothetical protein MUK42_35946 [Musa troglodytarum]
MSDMQQHVNALGPIVFLRSPLSSNLPFLSPFHKSATTNLCLKPKPTRSSPSLLHIASPWTISAAAFGFFWKSLAVAHWWRASIKGTKLTSAHKKPKNKRRQMKAVRA